ncbi:MAG: hypothetical protein DRP87_17955 [Spirochaetes bacterium]|nr:MAG: hypothetical protein DRP87_17955 [Spirochaetota bacterium]
MNKKMLNIFSRFILWIKKIFHIRPEPTGEKPGEIPQREEKSAPPKEELTEIKPSEKKIPQIPPEKEPVEAKPPEEKTPEVPLRQEIPSEESEETRKTKRRKPYKKKAPTEERKKEHRKLSGEEKRPTIPKPTTEIDLAKRKKPMPTKQPQLQTGVSIERTTKASEEKESHTRVESPHVEIDLDEAKVFFIIPKQQFETNIVNSIPQQLHYKLELNGDEKTISVRVSNNKEGIAIAEEKRIDLEQSLKNFKIVYPDELQGRVYVYQHSYEILYPFIATGKNLGRMHYLYDNQGNFNPLPSRDIWILLEEDFDLATEPDIIEERWIWEKYQIMCINLKNTNELVIKNRQTEEETKIPCEASFYLEGEGVAEDDFKRLRPVFTGNSIKIRAPTVNSSGWVIWIQNKKAGYKVITNNWTGNEPLELKLPDDLPCECGEFKADICVQEDRIPIETLFFRYVPFLQLKFSTDLIIPDTNIGHKQEIVQILLGRDFQYWELKLDEKVGRKHIENGYQVELLPEQDTLRFSLMKKGKPETETSFKITIPRIKWRTSKNKKWYDKPLQIKRDELIAGTDFSLTVCTNDFDTKYDLLAILETDGQRIQEAKFVRKGMVYNLLLNQFYDTIKKSNDKITLKVEIRKAKKERLLSQVNIIHFPEMMKEKPKDKQSKQPVLFKLPKKKRDINNIRPYVKGGSGMRKGKGFSRQEIIEAGVAMTDIRRLHVPFDKRRKSVYSENVETLKSLAIGE